MYSAFGPTLEGHLKPDLVAPGTNIISDLASTNSVVYQQHAGNRVNNYYFRMSGTSMAAPMVTGRWLSCCKMSRTSILTR